MFPNSIESYLPGTPLLFIMGMILLGIVVHLFSANVKKPSADELNAEATAILGHLVQGAKTANVQTAVQHLQELENIFGRFVKNHPDHELTGRLRWIITENMVVLSPYYLAGDTEARSVLAQYQAQLVEVKRLITQGSLSEASRAANQNFNWEHREFFTL